MADHERSSKKHQRGNHLYSSTDHQSRHLERSGKPGHSRRKKKKCCFCSFIFTFITSPSLSETTRTRRTRTRIHPFLPTFHTHPLLQRTITMMTTINSLIVNTMRTVLMDHHCVLLKRKVYHTKDILDSQIENDTVSPLTGGIIGMIHQR